MVKSIGFDMWLQVLWAISAHNTVYEFGYDAFCYSFGWQYMILVDSTSEDVSVGVKGSL